MTTQDAQRAATAAQSLPHGTGTDITPLVIADLEARSALGRVKYGQVLQAFNGRDPLIDLYQEILDAAQYCRQEIEERRRLVQFATWVKAEADRALKDGVVGGASMWADCLRLLSGAAKVCMNGGAE
jgi:hypothetical protein